MSTEEEEVEAHDETIRRAVSEGLIHPDAGDLMLGRPAEMKVRISRGEKVEDDTVMDEYFRLWVTKSIQAQLGQQEQPP